jgi:3-oxoacyl-[acyl-carrier protein] reductase
MDLGLKDKRALVLASSRGLGLGIAQAIAAEGAPVTLVGRSRDRLNAETDAINGRGRGKAAPLVADLSTAQGVSDLLAACGEVDVLVNNSGGPPPKLASAINSDDLDKAFAAMVKPLITITNHVLPGMRQRKWGRILTLASSGVVQPIANLALSNALRSSIVGWSKTLSNEVAADGVTVNIILPGRIHTERVNEIDSNAAKAAQKPVEEIVKASKQTIPVGRYGTVEEFAAVAAFLVSTPASYITGSLIRVDGGYMRSI